jgi:hypothetical protein
MQKQREHRKRRKESPVTETLVTSAELSLEFKTFSTKKIARLLAESECVGVRGKQLFLWVGSQAREIIRAQIEKEDEKRMRNENRAKRRASADTPATSEGNTGSSVPAQWGAPFPQIRPFPGTMDGFRSVVREKREQSETFWG